MKPKIHPEYFPEARVTCACGNSFTVGATVPEISTEVCSACHPFFTGEQRIVDTAGQVERFMRRLEAGEDQRQRQRTRAEQRREKERAAKRKRRGLAPVRSRTQEASKTSEQPSEDSGPPEGD